MKLSLRPCHSQAQSDADSDIWRLCSSSSQSETVVPASIVPSRFVLPAWKSRASTSEVLPVPRCPTTATLRIFPASMGIESSSASLNGSRESYAPAESRARRPVTVWSEAIDQVIRTAREPQEPLSPPEARAVTVPRHEAPVAKFNASAVCSICP